MKIGVKARPGTVLFGECSYDAGALRTPKAEALIAAAGPLMSLMLAAGLGLGALATGVEVQGSHIPTNVLFIGSASALMQFLFSALPIRYGKGLGEGASESDGRAIWRILTGAPPGGIARSERQLGRPQSEARSGFLIVLALVALLTLAVDPLLAVGLGALFAIALWLQRAGACG